MEEAAGNVAKEVPGAKVFAVTVDTGTREACEAAIAESERLAGSPPDVLINGVGGNKARFLLSMWTKSSSRKSWNSICSPDWSPPRAFAVYWIARGIKGCVINMTSMTSYKALSGTWAYDAAKAGVLNLNEALAKELAPQGIRVNAIAPAFSWATRIGRCCWTSRGILPPGASPS
jgi:NAD(P)-dependent dehydrogenase (short-subunit alcohol dehydrogenase family)